MIGYVDKLKKRIEKLDKKIKNLILALIIIFIAFTIASFIATQIFAKTLSYNSYFRPLIIIKGYPIYFPFSFIFWSMELNKLNDYRITFAIRKSLDGLFNTLLFMSLLLSIGAYLKKQKLTSHGTAKWITTKELKKSPYFHKGKEPYPDGVILGRDTKGNTIIDNEKTHISVVAPTRSGKGVGIIIPSLLNWRGSTLTFDLKGENFECTSGFRKSLNQIVLKFAPYQQESISYNPLAEIRLKTKYEFRDTQIIANILTEPGDNKARDHWDLSASTFLVGMILKVLYENPKAGLGDVVDFLTDPSAPLDNRLMKALNEVHTNDPELFKTIYGDNGIDKNKPLRHPKVAQTIAEILNKADKERASVISSALAKLILFKDPIVRQNTTRVDFRISDLMFNEKPVNLYIVIEPEAIEPLSPLMRILITQVIGRLTRDLEEKGRKNKLLLMLDEFPAFGKIELLEKALAYIAGYKMKAVLIGQSLNQFEKVYGEKNSVLDNCNVSIFYAPNPNDDKTPKLISEKLGNKTIEVSSLQNKEFSFSSLSVTRNKQGRNLMTPDEIRTLPEDRNLIFFGGLSPLKGIKIKYYLEPYFNSKKEMTPAKLETIKGNLQEVILQEEKERKESILKKEIEEKKRNEERAKELYLEFEKMQKLDKNSKEYRVFKEYFDNLDSEILKILVTKYNFNLNISSEEMTDEEQLKSLKENLE